MLTVKRRRVQVFGATDGFTWCPVRASESSFGAKAFARAATAELERLLSAPATFFVQRPRAVEIANLFEATLEHCRRLLLELAALEWA